MPTNPSRATQRFAVKGLQLAKTTDKLDIAELAIMTNIRQFILGQLATRPGLSQRNSSAMGNTTVHTIRRLNNDLASAAQANALVVGNGTRLDTSNAAETVYTNRATGFSGNPLSLVSFRPDQSPEPWMYVADSLKMGKVRVDGTFQNWGIAPPSSAPSATYADLTLNNIQNFQSAAGLTNGGTAGALATTARLATTIAQILYDSGTTGWCMINPTAPTSSIQPGSRLTINTGGGSVEVVLVDSVYKAISTTTIASIVYDSGTTGLCTIMLTTSPKEGLIPNAFIRIAGAENVRILNVIIGPNNVPCIRCSTTGTRAAGNTIAGLVAFRAFASNNHAAGEALDMTAVRSTVTVGTGTVDQTIAVDLSALGFRPTQPDDFLHISLRLDNISNLTEGRVILDCDGTTNDFAHNYFYAVFRANDFTPAVDNTTTQLLAKQRRIQRKLIDTQQRIGVLESKPNLPPRKAQRLAALQESAAALEQRLKDLGASPAGPPTSSSDETTTGSSQWTEFKFRLRDLQRVGSDTSRGLKDIAAYRLQFVVLDSTVVDMDDLYFAGGYGPDVADIGTPYVYISRFRSSTTGAKSNWSPPMRNGLLPHRQVITVTPQTSSDGQVDKIDIARFGGAVTQWTIVGTIGNSGSFTDDLPDDAIAAYPLADFQNFQPFPVEDVPRSTTVDVVGTAVTRTSGDLFNTSWARGTLCFVNGVAHNLYAPPSSAGVLALELSAGSQTGATLFIPSATIMGQPLPAVWGPFTSSSGGQFFFACGAVNQAGTLFLTLGNNPESVDERTSLDITSPSEPLMNGCVYDGRAYVWSDQRLFAITDVVPDPIDGHALALVQEVPNGKGLFARFALTVGPKIWFVSQDGIYETIGSEPRMITADLYPLFPHDGQPGTTVNGIVPPDFTLPNSMTLAYADGMVYYDFVDTSANRRTLVFNTLLDGWSYDIYTPPACVHYQEEGRGVRSVVIGGNDGRIYQLLATQTTDNGTAIACQVRTGGFDAGDFRAQKLWLDLIIDYLSAVSITATAGFDNYSSTTVLTALGVLAARNQVIRDLNSGVGQLARNITLDLTWSGQASIYGWEPSWLARPEDAVLRVTENDNLGYDGAKFVQGIIIEADTANIAKSILIQADNGANGVMTTQGSTLATITHNGRAEIAYSFAQPFIAHEVRILGNDSDPWKLFNWRWVWEPVPELVTDWVTQPTTLDSQGFFHIREVQIAHIATSDITLSVQWSDGTNPYVTDTYNIGNGAGAFLKTYLPLQARKMKNVIFTLTSAAGFRLFEKDLEVKWKSWGAGGPYNVTRPFGDISRVNGARI